LGKKCASYGPGNMVMFSYTIKCVTYAEKGSQAVKKLLQRLQGFTHE